jgi:hypothetical protein
MLLRRELAREFTWELTRELPRLPSVGRMRRSCWERAYELARDAGGILDPRRLWTCIWCRASSSCWAKGERLRNAGPFQ